MFPGAREFGGCGPAVGIDVALGDLELWEGAGEEIAGDHFGRAWHAAAAPCPDGAPAGCSPAQPGAVTLIPGAVFATSNDGHVRAHATADGRVLWDFDTAREFTTVNGIRAQGGSIDVGGPAIANGSVVTTSGYGQWGGMRGNVLLVFSVDGR